MDGAWDDAKEQCEEICRLAGLEPLETGQYRNELHYLAPNDASLQHIAARLAADHYFLVTLVANDEKDLHGLDRFRLYYIFSHPVADLFVSIVYPLRADKDIYPSIRPYCGGVEPFEREISDLLGLQPQGQALHREHGARLHEGCYPTGLYPLRREKNLAEIRQTVRDFFRHNHACEASNGHRTHGRHQRETGDGEMLLPVGPIHAGVIEPGHFLFHLAGEVVGSERTRAFGQTTGDVYARFVDRVEQADISVRLIALILEQWNGAWRERNYVTDLVFPDAIRRRTALGYAEGWRGDIVYWLMVNSSGRIYRCKVRDPSMLNWPALEDAIIGTYLSDFPLTNKSLPFAQIWR